MACGRAFRDCERDHLRHGERRKTWPNPRFRGAWCASTKRPPPAGAAFSVREREAVNAPWCVRSDSTHAEAAGDFSKDAARLRLVHPTGQNRFGAAVLDRDVVSPLCDFAQQRSTDHVCSGLK